MLPFTFIAWCTKFLAHIDMGHQFSLLFLGNMGALLYSTELDTQYIIEFRQLHDKVGLSHSPITLYCTNTCYPFRGVYLLTLASNSSIFFFSTATSSPSSWLVSCRDLTGDITIVIVHCFHSFRIDLQSMSTYLWKYILGRGICMIWTYLFTSCRQRTSSSLAGVIRGRGIDEEASDGYGKDDVSWLPCSTGWAISLAIGWCGERLGLGGSSRGEIG